MKRNLGSRCEDSTFYTGSIYLLICYNIIFDLFLKSSYMSVRVINE
jgi:hypothetical protein